MGMSNLQAATKSACSSTAHGHWLGNHLLNSTLRQMSGFVFNFGVKHTGCSALVGVYVFAGAAGISIASAFSSGCLIISVAGILIVCESDSWYNCFGLRVSVVDRRLKEVEVRKRQSACVRLSQIFTLDPRYRSWTSLQFRLAYWAYSRVTHA